MKLLILFNNKHAPIKKMAGETVKSLWTDEELKNGMVERDEAKGMANKLAAQPIGKHIAK
jgi:hypothetical protein